MGRTMETTALFTRMSSSLVLKKAEEFYFWGCSPPCDYENVLAEKFILCCSDQEGPGPQYQMQVILLSVTLVLPLKCGWPSTCISKCFGKEDGTVQGLGVGRGASKEPPSYKSKISILCYRIPIKEWYVKESIIKAVQLQKHVPSMEQGGQERWGKSLNGRYWCRSHTLSGASLAWSLGLHPCTTQGTQQVRAGPCTAAPFPSSRPCLIPQQTKGNTRTTGRNRGRGRTHGSPGVQLPGGADSSTPACLAASTLLWKTGQPVLEHS